MGDASKIINVPGYIWLDGVNLGYTDAGIEATSLKTRSEIKADQAGDTKIGDIVNGNGIELKTTFKEIDAAYIKSLFVKSGLGEEFTGGSCSDPQYTDQATCELNSETWTPSTETVFGGGTSVIGKNLASDTYLLKFVPLKDEHKDMTIVIWKAQVMVSGGLVFSGNDQLKNEVTFTSTQDSTKPAKIDHFFIGNPENVPSLMA